MGMMLVRRRKQVVSNAAKRSAKVEEPVVKVDKPESRPTKKASKKN